MENLEKNALLTQNLFDSVVASRVELGVFQDVLEDLNLIPDELDELIRRVEALEQND